tara:strand:+ start:1232 stop:2347 length:1116 start_codon:yes stop_codon:yes gene_type:complete
MAYTTIDDPSEYFQTALYTGNGSTVVTVTNDGNSNLQPDLLWFKRRDDNASHVLLDTTRGANVTSGFGPTGYSMALNPNTAASGVADSTGVMTITSDGFTSKEMTYAAGNLSTGSMVAWQWHCNGGTTSSNTDGDITSTVQVNTDAGFSIITYSGTTGDVHTIGHGLGVTPQVWIVKQDNTGGSFQNWFFWHHQMAASNVVDNRMLFLDTDANVATYTGINAVTSSTIRVKSSTTAQNGKTYVAYVFAEKKGFSKFGSYIGSGSAKGVFVWTGFKPAWVMVKNSYNNGWNWAIMDSKRNPDNTIDKYIWADVDASPEYDGTGISLDVDFLSNGFRLPTSRGEVNLSGATFIFMAFAENPFVTSTGVPATAR